jgi:protein-S-isoprenylcysteine O-methyltransferase Ste14
VQLPLNGQREFVTIASCMQTPKREETLASQSDHPGVIALPPLIYAAAFGLGMIVQLVTPWELTSSGWLKIVGAVVVASGLAVALWAERTMHGAGTHVDPRKPAIALVTEGPFRYTRNPMYLSLTLIYGGITLVVDALWPLVLLPAALLVMHYGVILREERYLERKFGEVYRSYKAQVRRWL